MLGKAPFFIFVSAGPIAPIKWMIDSMSSILSDKEKNKRRKLLLGLNHYGYDFTKTTGANAIVGITYGLLAATLLV